MADTVEQVYVWDGNDWVPVVRDETVSNTSELTNDGEDGVNPFITAADIPAVPDKKLPVDSADGTVVLDSPSANTFSISTGGAEVVRVTSDGVGIFRASGGYPLDVSTRNNLGVRLGSVAGVTNGMTIVNDASQGWVLKMDNQVPDDGSFGFIFQDRKLGLGTFGAAEEILHVVGNIRCDGGDIQTAKVVGPAANDASIDLGANATISTGGAERVKVAANGDTTFQKHVGIMSPAYSTVSLAIQGEVKPVNVGGSAGIWLSADYVVNPDATYEKHARAFASVKAPANGQTFDTFTQFYASAVCGNAVQKNFGVYVAASGAVNNYGCVVTRGGAIQDGNYGFYSNTGYPNYFDADIQTPRIVGSQAPATDASIELGTELLTTNHTPTQPNSIAVKQTVDDKIWVGTNAEYAAIAVKNPTTLYCLTD